MGNSHKGHAIRLQTSAHDSRSGEYRFNIEFYVFMENGVYISYCPSLDISTSANNYNEAIGNFYEMFQLYVETCIENNSLWEDLSAHGWKRRAGQIMPPAFSVILKKPEMKKLVSGGIGYEKVVAPAKIPVLA